MGQVTTEQYLEDIQNNLMAMLTKKKSALPPGFNEQRFALNCITVISDMLKDSKKRDNLQKVDPRTIPLCLIKGAYLGLDFLNGECYAIPYGASMNFQTDYKGEIKVCKKYSKDPIKDIYAKVVRSGDLYEEGVKDGVQTINFRPVPFSDQEIIGAFAVVVYKDGTMKYDSMSKAEIEHTRATYSKAKNSQAWNDSFGEMCKKTVIRRWSKLIDKDLDNIEQVKAYDEGSGFEFENNTGSGGRRIAPTQDAGEVIDALGGTVPQQTAALEDKGAKPPLPTANRTRTKEPEPERAGNNSRSQQMPEYDAGYFPAGEPQYDPGYAPDFDIPDDDSGLPFR